MKLLILPLLVFFVLFGNELPSFIDSVQLDHTIITITPHTEFSQRYLTEPSLYIEYDSSINLYELPLSIITAPAILLFSPMIWYSNQQYSIKEMDEDLFNSLKVIKQVFKLFWPTQEWAGELIPNKLVCNRSRKAMPSKAIVQLFSGGLDAVYTSFAHYDCPQLLITYWGLDVSLHKHAKWEQVKRQVIDFAQIHEQQTLFVRSNFFQCINNNAFVDSMKNWWARTSQGMGSAALALPLLYSQGYRKLLISSGRTSEFPDAYGTLPAIDSCIRCAGIKVKHYGGTMWRSDKIKKIAEVAKEKGVHIPLLRVCMKSDDGSNCCCCPSKCLMTMNEIMVEGLDPQQFGFPVDINTVIIRTKEAFSHGGFLKKSKQWHWECIKKRIEKYLAQEDFYSPKVAHYFKELLENQLQHLVIDNYDRIDKRLALQTLWEVVDYLTD